MALVSTLCVPAVAGVAILYGRYVRTITRTLLDKLADISKSAEERLGNIKTVKIFCKEHEEAKNYDNLLANILKIGYKEVMARSLFYGMVLQINFYIFFHINYIYFYRLVFQAIL